MTIERLNLSPVEKWLNPKERIVKAKEDMKKKGLIHNTILGWSTLQEVNQCIKDKIISFKNGYYCIPMEQKTLARGSDGKLLRNPIKEWVVSHKYYDYMIKTGRMKQNA